jgi:hypothetical protein
MPASRRTEFWPIPLVPETVALCAQVLADDERAREAGDEPLLTRDGLRFFLRLSVAARAAVARSTTSVKSAGGRKKGAGVVRWDAETG